MGFNTENDGSETVGTGLKTVERPRALAVAQATYRLRR